MRLVRLTLQNFRGFESLDLDFHPELTVLVGVNGSGKTSILDAIAVMLSGLRQKLLAFTAGDDRNGSEGLTVELSIEHQGAAAKNRYSPAVRLRHESFEPDRGWRQLADDGQGFTAPIPVIAYYRVTRYALDSTPGSTKPGTWEIKQAWDRALEPDDTSFAAFFQWFREREDVENEERRDAPEFRDRQLEAVRRAIESLVPGAANPRVRRPRFQQGGSGPKLDHPVIAVTKDGQELAFEQLSEGERTMAAMVGDIARRLAIANPDGDPLAGDGVVLIDEIDLHLHPEWQAKAIPALRRTFPKVQLVVTTHSPIVLAHVPRECVRLLEDFKVYTPPAHTKGRDANSLLVELFGMPVWPEESRKQIEKVANLIDEENLDEARAELARLSEMIGEQDAEVTRLRSFIDALDA
ncbi:MAG: AAA family ATPase [Acidobacteriota bacterium]